MAPTIEAVRNVGADLGIVLDTDVDRSGVVDRNGEAINRNRLIAFFATVVLRDSPGTTIVTDSTTSNGLKVRLGSCREIIDVTCHGRLLYAGAQYFLFLIRWDVGCSPAGGSCNLYTSIVRCRCKRDRLSDKPRVDTFSVRAVRFFSAGLCSLWWFIRAICTLGYLANQF